MNAMPEPRSTAEDSMLDRLPDIAFRYALQPVARFEYISGACERLTGYAPDDHYDDPGLAFSQVYPADLGVMMSLTRDPAGTPSPVSMRWVARGGSIRSMEVSFAPVRHGGEVVAIEGVARDITARAEKEAMLRRWGREFEDRATKLEECTRAQARLLADLVHEVRSPLASIMGFADLMIEGKMGPVASRHRDLLQRISSGAQHLLDIVRDSLTLAAASSGKMAFDVEDLDPVAVVREVAEILEASAIDRDVWVNVVGDGWSGAFPSDRQRLMQITCNYLSNAIKFSPRGGIVVVRLLPESNGHLRIEVEDTGPGVGPEDIGRLFVEFQQLDLSRAHEGTGLGLALTKRIVEAMGGTVGVETSPGRGARFHASIPPLSRDAPA